MGGVNMDWNDYGCSDPQAKPRERVGFCECGCGEEIYDGDEVIDFEGDLYIEERCLLKGIGARWIYAGEE